MRHRFPRWTVLAGYLAALTNLGLAAWQFTRGMWGWVIINVVAAVVVTSTTTMLIVGWRALDRARRQYQDALLREAERTRN